jgi:hypothetical protein
MLTTDPFTFDLAKRAADDSHAAICASQLYGVSGARGWHDAWVSHEPRLFQSPPPATPADVCAALDRGDVTSALDAMVGTALYHRGDWKELQELHLRLLEHDDRQVSALAATCLGHLARVHRQLDEAQVVGTLRRNRSVPHLAGTVAGALEDIEVFLHRRRTRWRQRLGRAIRPWT